MWVYNEDNQKWNIKKDFLPVSDFNFTKQELSSTRFYSKFLSGATYVPINSTEDLYEILGKWKPRSWFVSTFGSPYSVTMAPNKFKSPIDAGTIYDFKNRFLSEYGLTLKNLFTPKRLINDSLKNTIEVDLATDTSIDTEREYPRLFIDGIQVIKGNLILVKDQFTLETIDSTIDPSTYFTSNFYKTIDYGSLIEYRYYNQNNGIYLYDGRFLIKQDYFSDYEKCIRAVIYVRSGATYEGKQFHLSRLLSGYFPTSRFSEPMEFTEKKNWLLRHRVDYNNIYDLNYYDVVTQEAQQYSLNGVTYSIPQRTLAVGEFGVILNTQDGTSNIVPSKFKVNLRSISSTLTHYWICGDEATLIKVRKHDFEVTKVKIQSMDSLKSVSFYNNQRGAVVGDLNNILLTFDGGDSWKRLRIEDFAEYNYTKVLFTDYNRFYVVGRNGVFIEVEETPTGWLAYKRRISKILDDDDDVELRDNINDIVRANVKDWNLTYRYYNDTIPSDIDTLIMTTDSGNIVAYDRSKATKFNFIYLNFREDYGDIINISKSGETKNFYFSNNDGLYSFNISDFEKLGVGNSYSNVSISIKKPVKISDYYANEIYDYKGISLNLAGNSSLMRIGTYSVGGTMSSSTPFEKPDVNFESRLTPKMLFLNYDMASKLNFFTDAGEYRLPKDVSFNTNIGSTSSRYTTSLMQSQPPAVLNNPLDAKEFYKTINVPNFPSKTKGRVKEIRVNLTVNMQSSLVSIVLRRKITGTNFKIISLMRYGQQNAPVSGNLTNVTFSTNTNLPSISTHQTTYTSTTFRMDLVNAPFTVSEKLIVNTNSLSEFCKRVNGIDEVSGDYDLVVYDHYGYGVSLFGWSIEFVMEESYLALYPKVNPPTAPSYITKTEQNWWTYWSNREVTFEYGPTSSIPSDASKVIMSSTFSSYASYSVSFPYELTVVSSSVSTDPTDIIKLVPNKDDVTIGKYIGGININLSSANAPKYYGENPVLYLWKYLAILETDNNWPVVKGDMLRLTSSIVDTNMMVNRIISGTRTVGGNTRNRKYVYMYTNFNDNIINDLRVTSGDIKIRNLNRYISIDDLVTNFEHHPLGTAYGITHSEMTGILNVNAKFNNKTAYYNLGTVVEYDSVRATMSYDESFLKFGYSPTYNILDYLESINKSQTNPTFYADKEYYSMPVFHDMIMANPFNTSSIYIDATGLTYSKYIKDTGNKMAFGSGLNFEWESLILNTFVDVDIYQPLATPNGKTFSSPRLLITKKYIVENYLGSGITGYVVEFHKRINYEIGNLNNSKIRISSRRKLSQISDDIKFMNNIQNDQLKINEISSTVDIATFSSYDNHLGFRISTDSYAKVLMSDAETVSALSAIFYVDSKNELAMNITKLDRAYDIQINSTLNYNGYLYINCSTKHELSNHDGVVLEFNGGTYSSQFLNTQYFGYHNVKQVINDYDFVVDIPWGNQVFVGNDTGFVRYLRKDPFLNYQPVDLIEVGSDRTTKISIKIEPENIALSGATFSLNNIDYDRYRFKLVDGLTLVSLSEKFPWMLEAEISDAIIGFNNDRIIWYKGTWESGRWFDGIWYSGDWLYGDWYAGEWNSVNVSQKGLGYVPDSNTTDYTKSVWRTGRWYGGTWNNGTWATGRWYGGTWNNGRWYNGIWNEGTWNVGVFSGGIWVGGTWNDGYFNCDSEPSFWVNGEWKAGDFENGIWYNGVFGSEKNMSKFGVKSSNSRTAIWYGGVWKEGSFHSGPYTGLPKVSDVHKYSIWYTGQWLSGDFYGGVAYNMIYNKGTWHGGILEDIQVIGMNSANNSFILNGIFRFNIGDIFYVIDDNTNNEYSYLGNNTSPTKYTVLKTVLNETEKMTEVYVDYDIELIDLPSHKRNTGKIDINIPNTDSYVSSTISVTYSSTSTNEVRVKLNLKNRHIGDLLMNLKSPNGQVINLKTYGLGGTQSTPLTTTLNSTTRWIANSNYEMVNTFFTTATVSQPGYSSPMTDTYNMEKTINVGAISGSVPLSTTDRLESLFNNDGGVVGKWTLYIKDQNPNLTIPSPVVRYKDIGENLRVKFTSSLADSIRIGDLITVTLTGGYQFESEIIDKIGSAPGAALILSTTASTTIQSNFTTLGAGFSNDKNNINYGNRNCNATAVTRSNPYVENKLVDWEIQFVNDVEVGAQISFPKTDGIDTGLRVVSDFRNVDWLSGIWTNGILEKGNFGGGLWFNGIMKGNMGI